MRLNKYMLAVSLGLSLVACGKSEAPIQTEPITTTVLEDSKFLFEIPDITSVLEEVPASTEVQNVTMFLSKDLYYQIQLPANVEYITDNYSYIYGKNNEFSIQLVSECPVENLSTFASISKPEAITKSVIRSKAGTKGPMTAAKHLGDDRAYILNVYSNPEIFSTILDCFTQFEKRVNTYTDVVINLENEELKLTRMLDILPDYKAQGITVTANMTDNLLKQYTFDTGSLTVSRDFKRFEEAKEFMRSKLGLLTRGEIVDEMYETEDVLYMTLGDYTIGVYKLNFNTSVCLWGDGVEARNNIVAWLREVK